MPATHRLQWSVLVSFVVALASSASAQSVIATVPVAQDPTLVAVNSATNKIYVVSEGGGTGTYGAVTVIDGATNATVTVGVESSPSPVAVNPANNKVYVVNFCGLGNCAAASTVSIIHGTTLATTVTVGHVATGIAVNPVTNQVFVANGDGG